jgi:1-acyl-sn-glycerol-3-phosphate acyltransferase
MTFFHKVVNALIKGLLSVVCRLHAEELKQIPQKGPLISIGNHINFIEAPVMAVFLQPRPIAALAKVETWDNPFKRVLFNLWGGIPVTRGEADRTAIRLVLQALEEEKIVGIAPEGTRSHHGALQKAQPGVVLIALKSGAPIFPTAFYGNEFFWENLRKLKRTDVYIRVGNAFRLDSRGDALSRDVREQMTSEIMYQLAALLPPQNRGFYADLENATSKYLVFEPGIKNNLAFAGGNKEKQP